MKSKKKLIYKLHQNINQNPFKREQEQSFRNVGVRSYDFNKLRSIRAISMKGAPGETDLKRLGDERMLLNGSKFDHYEDQEGLIQQRLLGRGKNSVVDRNLMNLGEKKVFERNLSNYQQDYRKDLLIQQSIKRSQSINPRKFNEGLKSGPKDNHHMSNNSGDRIKQKGDDSRPMNPAKHLRNVSLPVISQNHDEEVNKKAMNVVGEGQAGLQSVEEQRAKEMIMRQLGVNGPQQRIVLQQEKASQTQSRINKQVLASIKLKSIDNLGRIARSHSEAVIVDKWKEKYSQESKGKGKKSNQPMGQKLNQKLLVTESRPFLPQIHNTHLQRFNSYHLDEQEGSDENFYANIKTDAIEEQGYEIAPNQDYSDLRRQYLSQQMAASSEMMEKKHFFRLNDYLSRQIPNERVKELVPRKEDFFDSQPLKINITKVKKHERKNKQNLNLQKPPLLNLNLYQKLSIKTTQKLTKIQTKSHTQESSSEPKEKTPQRQVQKQSEFKRQANGQQKSQSEISREKIKSFLSFKDQGYKHEKKQPLGIVQSKNLNKNRVNFKQKTSDERALVSKMIESEAMIEWQSKRYADMEEMEFHAFVKNRTNQIGG